MDQWMSNLPEHVTNLPLTEISIPGSHDSCSYPINAQSALSPDNEAFDILKALGKVGQEISSRWGRTQDENLTEQLTAGIRYFDLRVCRSDTAGVFYFVHGQFARELASELFNVRVFLRDHPKEVVLLDFNHVYGCEEPEHINILERTIVRVFGSMLAPCTEKAPTLSELWERGQQVVCFFKPPRVYNITSSVLWPQSRISSPWADTVNLNSLIDFLERHPPPPNRDNFHVTQGILTPNAAYILNHMSAGLPSLADPAGTRILQWLTERASMTSAGDKCRVKPNIVILDFCVKRFSAYAQTVVNLNFQ